MTRTTTIYGLGTSVEVELGDTIDRAAFEQAWSRCLSPALGGEQGAGPNGDAVGPAASMTSLTQTITRGLIYRRRGQLLMLHAGAVSHPKTGASIAYVAPGGTGKTTLSRLLGARYGYLTDETVGIDPATRRIHPYPKPLSTRASDGGHPKSERPPDELSLRAAHAAPILEHLILLRRDADATHPRWTRLDLFDAIMAVVPETSSLSRLERPLHMLSNLYSALNGFWLVEYAEASDLLDRIGERLETS